MNLDQVSFEPGELRAQGAALNTMIRTVNRVNKKWWVDLNTGEPVNRNVGEALMLVVSELAEAMEGHRKNLMDDKIPHRKMFEVECADAVIRICDLLGGLGFEDAGGAYQEKMEFNATRKDHTREHRLTENGKKY